MFIAPPPPPPPPTSQWEGSTLLTPDDFHDYQVRTVDHIMKHRDSMLFLSAGLGKQQPLTSKVLTCNGWSTMGDMVVGEKLIHPKGGTSTVIGVFPQGEHLVYEITLSDGRVVECGRDHLWTVDHPSSKGSKREGTLEFVRAVSTFTTAELQKRAYKNYKIINLTRLDYPKQELPIHPYLLGALIADGSFTKSTHGVRLSYHVKDVFIRDKIEKLLPDGMIIGADRHTSDNGKQCILRNVDNGRSPNILRLQLNKMGLGGTHSGEKFIPKQYLIASHEQRLDLLRGLMDCDGSIRSRNRKQYSTTSHQLMLDVRELVRSLGGNTGLNIQDRIKNGKPCNTEYNISISFIDTNPFTLPRKANLVNPTKMDRVSAKIVNIRCTPKIVPQQCIKIDRPDGLYVTDNYVVTHNTSCTLTAFSQLKTLGLSKKMLVVAPLRVCQLQWEQETQKWAHLDKQFKFSKMIGASKKRQTALFTEADIYLVNYESLKWLAQQLEHYFIKQKLPLPFDVLVFDEVSKMKRSESARFGIFAPLTEHFERRIGLTASPASNGLINLWAQFYCLDNGERLGHSYKQFTERYFHKDDGIYGKQIPYSGKNGGMSTKDMIVSKISDMTIEIPADGNLDMPPFTVLDIYVTLPPAKYKQYVKLEQDLFVELDNGTPIEPFNTQALASKIQQFANGRIYNHPDELNPDYRETEYVHDHKYDALHDIITETGDEPILLSYQFTSERDELMKRYPDARCMTGVKEDEAIEIADKFNKGEIKLLIAHALSLGYGVNLQESCSILVHFGLGYNLETHEQFNWRINRQGQTKPVRCFRILARDTIDIAIKDALAAKELMQDDLKKSINDYRKSKGL